MYNTDFPGRAELPSSRKLLVSTLVAALVAGVLLVTTVLPAEYGIDPTGAGRVLGLTQMGEIKMALAAEARAESASAGKNAPSKGDAAPRQTAVTASEPAVAKPTASQNTATVRLKPGQGAEVKLVMRKDAVVRYEWASAGGAVNYDTHGDPHNAPKSFYHGYGKGQNESSNAGTLQAAFDGKHGWFWRNRTNAEVTVTLKVEGDYEKMERVL